VSRIGGYETAPDATAADWIALGLRGFAESVLSLVPAGFEAYARIFHPAARAEAPTRVRWQEVATANGRVAHPAMQWPSIVKTHGFADGGSQPGLWDQEPDEGCLPEALRPLLAAVLTRHTATPEKCWFAIWDGYGSLALPDDEVPAFEIPNRRMLLLTGRIGAVRTSPCAEPFWQSPNMWWPDDRAWCVATEIDLMSTYVGGSRQCVLDLVDHPELEAVIVPATDGVTWGSDHLNPSPM
jgi:hypothetical protein